MGGLDRAVRLSLGVILLPAGLSLLGGNHGYGLVLVVVGLIGLATGTTGFCAPYALLGISTAPRTAPGAKGPETQADLERR